MSNGFDWLCVDPHCDMGGNVPTTSCVQEGTQEYYGSSRLQGRSPIWALGQNSALSMQEGRTSETFERHWLHLACVEIKCVVNEHSTVLYSTGSYIIYIHIQKGLLCNIIKGQNVSLAVGDEYYDRHVQVPVPKMRTKLPHGRNNFTMKMTPTERDKDIVVSFQNGHQTTVKYAVEIHSSPLPPLPKTSEIR